MRGQGQANSKADYKATVIKTAKLDTQIDEPGQRAQNRHTNIVAALLFCFNRGARQSNRGKMTFPTDSSGKARPQSKHNGR